MRNNSELKSLYEKYKNEFHDREVVLGNGNVNSEIVLIGEAPGRHEVLQQMPFVGQAGKNLIRFLESIDFKREDIFITNAIKYRLSKENPKSGRIVNRPATSKDIELNLGYLHEEMKILAPKWIVTLGNVPLKMIAGKSINIGMCHGKLINTILGTQSSLIPLYHPASIIYNRELENIYTDDLKSLKRMLSCKE